jgi:hypothetical protein
MIEKIVIDLKFNCRATSFEYKALSLIRLGNYCQIRLRSNEIVTISITELKRNYIMTFNVV